MAAQSNRYSSLRRSRLEAFVAAVRDDGIPMNVIARIAEDTAPAGWAIDLGQFPSAAKIAEALEEGEVE